MVVPLLSFAQQTTSTVSTSSSISTIKNDRSTQPALTLKRTLQKGAKGDDVKALQEYLKRIPGIYPNGSATGYFGVATEAAIQRLQKREGLVDSQYSGVGYGVVGAQTLAKINEMVSNAEPIKTVGATSTPSSLPPATTTPPLQTSLPLRDTSPPVRTGSSFATLPLATSEVRISLTTNEPARCYWSNTPGTPFEYMTTAFAVTGGTTHSSLIESITAGDYAFFAKCRDQYLNTNTSDYPILFSIERRYSGRDRNPPRVVMSAPTSGDVTTEGLTNLSAATADNIGVAAVNFLLNSRDLGAEDTTSPFGVSLMLKKGTYSVVAVARDVDGNYATSTTVIFSVTAKPSTFLSPLDLLASPTLTLTPTFSALLRFFSNLLRL